MSPDVMTGVRVLAGGATALWDTLTGAVAAGSRFAGLFGTTRPEGLVLSAHLARAATASQWPRRSCPRRPRAIQR